MSAEARRALTVSLALSSAIMVCAVMQPLYFPELKALGPGLEVACRAIAAAAALVLLRCRWGRIGIGPFLFGAGLLTLNLNGPPFTSRIPSEAYLLAEVLFGSSVLVIVLDEWRLGIGRQTS